MKQFKNAVPLIMSLKNDAFTERHWKMLMKKTGIFFTMNQNDMTLDSVFAMNIHKDPVSKAYGMNLYALIFIE